MTLAASTRRDRDDSRVAFRGPQPFGLADAGAAGIARPTTTAPRSLDVPVPAMQDGVGAALRRVGRLAAPVAA